MHVFVHSSPLGFLSFTTAELLVYTAPWNMVCHPKLLLTKRVSRLHCQGTSGQPIGIDVYDPLWQNCGEQYACYPWIPLEQMPGLTFNFGCLQYSLILLSFGIITAAAFDLSSCQAHFRLMRSHASTACLVLIDIAQEEEKGGKPKIAAGYRCMTMLVASDAHWELWLERQSQQFRAHPKMSKSR